MALFEASSQRHLEDGVTSGRPAPLTDQENGSDEIDWLDLANRSFQASETFQSGYLMKGWSKSIDHFNNRHADGSRFRSAQYQGQIRLFRPKTRSMIRRGEAECARAFFSTQEVVNIAPEDDGDETQRASAEVVNSILNYRLTKRMPWFKIVMGQYQTAQVMGVCVSKQYWRFEEKVVSSELKPLTDELTGLPRSDEQGVPLFTQEHKKEVIKDDLVVEPVPPENLRIDEGADWLDPMNSAAFLIYRIPMYVDQVRMRARETDPKTGQPQWFEVDVKSLISSRIDTSSVIRQKREQVDRVDGTVRELHTIADHDLVWVHENIVRLDGEDWHYYTLGTEALLTDPRPLKEVYRHLRRHERPFTFGLGQIEAFRLYPESKVQMSADLQVKANYLDNFRLENVLQILHPKTLVAENSGIDLQAMSSPRIGISLKSKKPMEDVNFIRPPDVTRSAYEEQNSVNNDFDDLTGDFSGGTVSTNRQMNETVGGLNLISGAASGIKEYELRIFTESWFETTLAQCVRLVQAYESDPVVVALAGKKANVWQRYGKDPLVDDLLSAELTTTVNVGIGSINPEIKMQRFAGALKMVFGFLGPLVQQYGPQVIESPGAEAIVKEVFGLAGYKDGKRFLDFTGGEQSPEVMQMQQAMEQMKQELQDAQQKAGNKELESKTRIQTTAMQQQGETQRTQMKIGADLQKHRSDQLAAALSTLGGSLQQAQPMGSA